MWKGSERGACAERARAPGCREETTGRNKLEREGDRNHSDRVETWQRARKRSAEEERGGESDKLKQSRLWTRPHLPLEPGGEEGRHDDESHITLFFFFLSF